MTDGHPIQIVDLTDDHSFELNEDHLRDILFHPDCKSKKVVVISIAGAFRKGKSFLLDFFLRYLRADDKDNWMGCKNEPLTGFHWRGGCERDTTGIIMWSKPFIVKKSNGEAIAILLMDTQGAFDSMSTVRDCATVFALSLMLSSVQIYNLTQNVQEDDLQHLNLFAEYGTLALNSCNETPFQKLTFLVRDWSYPYEAHYGYDGGEKLLEKRLKMNPDQHAELRTLRQQLIDSFKKINCFLMPHPGLKVASHPQFDGRLSEVEPEFLQQLNELVPSIFSPTELLVKEINGEEITGTQLFEYFKAYYKVFQSDELPHPKAVLQATAEANNLAAKANARDFYLQQMEEHCGGDRPYMHLKHLIRYHDLAANLAIEKFTMAKKMGGEELSLQYLNELAKEINHLKENYVKQNDSKNIFAFSRTPTTFLSCMIISYFICSLMKAMWLDSLSTLFMMSFWISFIFLFLWLYCKYSGEHKDFGEYLDTIADMIWTNVYQPIYQQFVQTSVRSIVNSTNIDNHSKSD
ncbi:hypothetical protein GJ496_004807 [Pomphorhynchus laevis]|nr:hypothetical protein GJ496_004807 [Pomphorhynchus laevis]